MSKLALLIDDEPDIRELLDITLNRMSVDCHLAEDLTSARKLLDKNNYDLCLTDMKLPDGDGVEFVSEIQLKHPTIPVAVITAHGSIDSAILALKNGAFDFLTKPVDLNLLRTVVKDALNLSRDVSETKYNLVGQSKKILELRKTINKLARSQAPIYISGESGTGKELVARLIHHMGARSDNAFVPVNCGAIPPELMESEFFGHKKGSFTGAVSDKEGLFQTANNGTLFLDEIADLPQNIQVKLLRAIQEKNVRPIGSQQEVPVNTRILSATHKNLADLVDAGAFRKDLYYRVNVIEVHVPALRERKEDIPLLVAFILNKLQQQNGLTDVSISESAMRMLNDYDYPGNVRELENILERAVTMCDGTLIDEQDIALEAGIAGKDVMVTDDDRQNISTNNLEDYLVDIEKQAILDALNANKWNRTAAAKQLGISLRALRYRLDKLGID